MLLLLLTLLITLVPAYDYLLFALQWKPGVCESHNCPSGYDTTDFSIHGLWPSNNDGSYPEFCSNPNSFTIHSSTEAQLNRHWPSYRGNSKTFWEHEWNKHGTCVSSAEISDEYFSKGVSLFLALGPENILDKSGIYPGDKPITPSKFFSAFDKIINIKCASKGGKNYLDSVRLCYSQSYEWIDCQQKGESCGEEFYYNRAN